MSAAKPGETSEETRARWARDHILSAPPDFKPTAAYRAFAATAGPLPDPDADDFFDTSEVEP